MKAETVKAHKRAAWLASKRVTIVTVTKVIPNKRKDAELFDYREDT